MVETEGGSDAKSAYVVVSCHRLLFHTVNALVKRHTYDVFFLILSRLIIVFSFVLHNGCGGMHVGSDLGFDLHC